MFLIVFLISLIFCSVVMIGCLMGVGFGFVGLSGWSLEIWIGVFVVDVSFLVWILFLCDFFFNVRIFVELEE